MSRLVCVGLFVFACICTEAATLPHNLLGAWQEDHGAELIHIELDRIVGFYGGGSVVVHRFVDRNGDTLILRKSGLREEWRASIHGATLRLEHEGKTSAYQRLDRLPPQVELAPFPVAAPRPLPQSRVQDIREEIGDRFEQEQAALKDPTRGDKASVMRRDNWAYLRGLLIDVGWIDSDRFGQRTSVYAVILAKHTEDLRLMLTVLPFASMELIKSGKGQTYALLYDAVQLQLGHKQLYGTQVTEDAKSPFVLPLEDPANVDKRRAELGLPKLATYITQVQTHLYNGRPVRIADDH